MPKSTASGKFAHDGANPSHKVDDHSGNQPESDCESMYASHSGLTTADTGPLNPLFPPSIIAPFIALLKIGLAATSTPFATTSAPFAMTSTPFATTSTPSESVISETQNMSFSLPTAPPSSSSAPPLQTSSVISSSSSSMRMPGPSAPGGPMRLSSVFPFQVAAGTTPMHLDPSESLDTPLSSIPSQSSISSGGKRKHSAIADFDSQGSLKRRGPRKSSGSARTVPQAAGDTAVLQGFSSTVNHFSDVVHLNNETQPHSILKDASSKLTGAWGAQDKFTDGQKIVLLKLFRQNQAIASLYASTSNSRVRRGYALSELEPHQNEIDHYDAEEDMDDL
jgi:hypothetical protein